MTKETLLPELFRLFRQYGYDGVSLSKISAATGLGRASLYYHFPGGKAEMLSATLDYSQQWFEENVVQVLQAGDTAEETAGETAMKRLQNMCDRLNQLYVAGEQPCLMATLTVGAACEEFHASVKQRLQAFVDAIAAVLIETGLSPESAQLRAQDALIAIQGALILSRGLDDLSPFQRVIAQLPQTLCQQTHG